MDDFTLGVFLFEIERQSTFLVIATDDLRTALAANDWERTWYSIQAAVIAGGNLSKLFQPPNPQYRSRGAELREILGVSEESPLLVRKFRNRFEHFDEEIEEWATTDEHMVDSSAVPADVLFTYERRRWFMRNFDTDRFSVTF